jgi:MoxR-like ATPase
LEDAQPARYVHRHPAFRVFATDNAMGAAMEDDRFGYAGTNSDQNAALLDRFGSFVEVPYMTTAAEYATLTAKVRGLDREIAEGMIRVANNVRASNEIQGGFSLRMLLEWGRRVAAGQLDARGKRIPVSAGDRHVLEAAEGAFLRRQSSALDRAAIVEVIRRIFVVEDGGADD